MSINRGMDKADDILPSHKKKEIMPFSATWMVLEIIILSRVSQTARKMPYDITYIWNLIEK